jgi:hypothetical protein
MEVSEPKSTQEPAASPATRSTDANGPALHFLLGAQRILVEEMVFSAEATLDRIRTEIHLLEVGRIALGSGLEEDGPGMRPASA